ncbi:hypothetical protein K8R47_00485 [archaeon]|nr:hypothetical protein [archaeon]
MRYPVDELLDKRSIILLKIKKIDDDREKARLQKEYGDYTEGLKKYIEEGICTGQQIEDWHNRIFEANEVIWNLESQIRKGKVEFWPLEEVGRTALQIRKSNGARIGIKSEIAEKTGIGYKDIKINHASE